MKNVKQIKMFVENSADILKEQFETIAENYPLGVTIIIPNPSKAGDRIAEIVLSKSKSSRLAKGTIIAPTTKEVGEMVLDKNSYFREFYGGNFEEAYSKFTKCLNDMNTKNNGVYSRRLVRDAEMRNVITSTFKKTNTKYSKKTKLMADVDVLVVDDGNDATNIRELCKTMMDTYTPKSITILTLLQK